MFTDPGFTLADQLFWIVECFRKAMWAEPRTRGLGALSVAIWVRVKRFERRFSRLYAMWKAGTLPPPRPSPASAGEGANGADRAVAHPPPRPFPSRGEGEVAAQDAARERPASVLPRAFRWLQKMLPISAGTLAAGVDSIMWNYPEMKQFAADCPQVGRILRPLARMAGLKVPDYVALPKRKRKKRALRLSDEHEAELARLTARFPDTPPARSAKRALRRMFAGLPVNWDGLSAVARGYVVHPPRDENCPPPEIGYGGRRRPLPTDYKPPPKDWV